MSSEFVIYFNKFYCLFGNFFINATIKKNKDQ